MNHNSLNFGFTNIWGIRSDFDGSESLLESKFPNILALCETNLEDTIDSENVSVGGYPSLFRKYCVTHMHGLVLWGHPWGTFARRGGRWSSENRTSSYERRGMFICKCTYAVIFFFAGLSQNRNKIWAVQTSKIIQTHLPRTIRKHSLDSQGSFWSYSTFSDSFVQ